MQADIFTRLSVFDSPKGSSNTFTTHKNISPYFKRRYLIIYKYCRSGPLSMKIQSNLLNEYLPKTIQHSVAAEKNKRTQLFLMPNQCKLNVCSIKIFTTTLPSSEKRSFVECFKEL